MPIQLVADMGHEWKKGLRRLRTDRGCSASDCPTLFISYTHARVAFALAIKQVRECSTHLFDHGRGAKR